MTTEPRHLERVAPAPTSPATRHPGGEGATRFSAGGLLAAVRRRPGRRDVTGVAACALAQLAVIGAFAAVPRESPGTPLDLQPIGVVEMFTHNGSVFLLWLAGALTLGLTTLVLAGVSSVTSGLAIGAALDRNGLETLAHLGHAVLEIPALAIALWLSLRPLGWALSSLRSPDDEHRGSPVATFVSGLAWWMPVALLLLVGAAAWEVATPFLPVPTP